MLFLLICAILFIRVISGSRITVFFTADGTDVHRLRTFGSTLMLFLFICAIRFICVIYGSLAAEAGGSNAVWRVSGPALRSG
jgi:hypothetical protein